MLSDGKGSNDVTCRSPFVVSTNEGVEEKGGNHEMYSCYAEESILAGAGFSKATAVALASDKLRALFQHL